LRRSIYILIILLCGIHSNAQEAMYVPATATIYIGSKQPVSVFGHFLNEGNVGMDQNGSCYFFGKIFHNATTAKLTDASLTGNSQSGGTFIFQQPNPVYGDLGQQLLDAAYADNNSQGPSFSRLAINNANGVAITSDVNIIGNVQFIDGRLYHNKHIVVLGDSTTPATVTGYNDQRFFVTGKDIDGGSLKIRSLGACCITTFPIGTDDNNYAPVQLRNLSTKDDYYVSAFTTETGSGIPALLPPDSSINIIWKIRTTQNLYHNTEISLQHNVANEGAAFSYMRLKSYITMATAGGWDKPASINTPQTPGNITTGGMQFSTMVNRRSLNIGNTAAFISKKVQVPKVKLVIPNAFSPNADGINDTWEIRLLNEFPDCRVEIFERNGQRIYSSIGYNNPWNGTLNGKALPVATYYYIIDLKNGEPPLSGSITILR